MLLKTSELTGPALDWAVAIALEHKPPLLRVLRGHVALPQDDDPMWCDYLDYSTDWAQGGPIIEREMVDLNYSNHQGTSGELWDAACEAGKIFGGSTPLIAAMRCFVASKLGDEVDVPEELCPAQSPTP